MYKETHLRSIVKTISWRVLATLTTISLVYIFIGDLTVAVSVGGIEVFLKMLVYFLHERAWDKIKFGKKEIQPAVIWFTGLAKSGKKDIAKLVEEKLKNKGYKVAFLDGRSIRNLIPEIGYTREDVNLHIKRVGFLAKKLEEHGVFVVASFLSPYKESREFVKNLCQNYFEIFVNTPLEICKQRDETGVYKLAEQNKIQNFPGVHFDYEKSDYEVLEVSLSKNSTQEIAENVINYVNKSINLA